MAEQVSNIYDLLEGELLSTETSVEAVTKAIIKKKAFYTKSRDPKVVAMRSLKLKELDDFAKQIKENPNLIQQHAAAYKEIERQKRIEREKVLREKGTFFVQNGTISETNLKMLMLETKMTENEILQMLGARKKSKKNFSYEDDNTPELEEKKHKEILIHLNVLEKKSIYEYLGLKQNAQLKEIQSKIEEIRVKVSSSSRKNIDPKINSEDALVKICAPIFATEAGRKSYDKSLENAGFLDAKGMIQMLRGSGYIKADQYKHLLSLCTKNGLSRAKAEYLIYKAAKEVDLDVDEGGTDSMIACRYCGTLNDSNFSICRECGMPVVVKCPSCGKESATDDLTCTHCGFSLIGMKDAPIYLKMAQIALESNNIEDAEKHYTSAHNAWPTYSELTSLKDLINKRRINVARLQKEVETLCKKKFYYAARKNSNALPASSLFRREIESAINTAETAIQKAETESDPNRRLDLYIQALNACADCSTANDKMRANPLAAPKNLTAVAEGNHIRLSWQKTESNYISYLIVRKEKSQPTNSNDGEKIGETINATYDDLKAIAGISYFYAVFSKYGDFISPKATVIDRPVMRVEDLQPSQIKVNPTEKSLEFTINAPKGIFAIDIYRDGTFLKSINGNSFIDNGLVCEQNYAYKFIAVYKDSLGNTHKSQGVEMTFAPMPRLNAVDLSVQESAEQALLQWTTPKEGALYIYYSEKPFSYNPNDIIAIDSFRAQRLNVTGQSCTITKDFSGERYYLPVTIKGNIGVAGKGVSVVSIAKLANTRIERQENEIKVKWQWGNTSEVRLRYCIDGTTDKTFDFSQEKGDKDNYNIVLPKSALSVEITLCSIVHSNGKELLGTPIREVITLQASHLEFTSIENQKRLFFATDDYILSIKAQAVLPCDIHVIAKEQMPPIDLVNYTPLATIKAADIRPNQNTQVVVHYVRKKKGEKLYFRLVAVDRTAAKKIIISPETLQLK